MVFRSAFIVFAFRYENVTIVSNRIICQVPKCPLFKGCKHLSVTCICHARFVFIFPVACFTANPRHFDFSPQYFSKHMYVSKKGHFLNNDNTIITLNKISNNSIISPNAQFLLRFLWLSPKLLLKNSG